MNVAISLEAGAIGVGEGAGGSTGVGKGGLEASLLSNSVSFRSNWQSILSAVGGGLGLSGETAAESREETGETATVGREESHADGKSEGTLAAVSMALSKDGAIAAPGLSADRKSGWVATTSEQTALGIEQTAGGRGVQSNPAKLKAEDAGHRRTATQSDEVSAGHQGIAGVKGEKRESRPRTSGAGSGAGTGRHVAAVTTPDFAAASATAPLILLPVMPQGSKSAPAAGVMARALWPIADLKSGGNAAESRKVTAAGHEAAGAATSQGMVGRTTVAVQAAGGNVAAAGRNMPNARPADGDLVAGGTSETNASPVDRRAALERAAGGANGDDRESSGVSERRVESQPAGADGVKSGDSEMGAQHSAETILQGQMQAANTPAGADQLSLYGSAQAREAASEPRARGSVGEMRASAAIAGAVQPVNAGMDATARVPVSGNEGPSVSTSDVHRISGDAERTASGLEAHETFTAADAGTAVGTPGWIHAGAQRAEAGFEDPALGWVGVKADLSGGSVHASLVPGTADAAQALSMHLEGLHAYLAAQHTPVATVTVGAPGGGGMEMGSGQSMQHSAGQDAGYSGPGTQQQGARGISETDTAPEAQREANLGSMDRGSMLTASAPIGAPRGVHISVMA